VILGTQNMLKNKVEASHEFKASLGKGIETLSQKQTQKGRWYSSSGTALTYTRPWVQSQYCQRKKKRN
jgi:hypothetical protein